MPARIEFQAGMLRGHRFAIERAVTRVGSAPHSDICIPNAEFPNHAMTLEYRDGVYRVYNRSDTAFHLSGNRLLPGEALAWPDSDVLELDNGTQLILDVDVDPRPMPVSAEDRVASQTPELENQPHSSDEIGLPVAGLPAESRPAMPKSNLIPILVICLCGLGSLGLLARHYLKDAVSSRSTLGFDEIVEFALQDEAMSEATLTRFQLAEAAVIRGHRKLAAERYGALRSYLIQNSLEHESSQAVNVPEQMIDFIEYRLSQLVH
ncbi:FHA domain-containing protein [Aureliella helgolandensis]|uniref:FHA domain-containing protein n=1 Tax=Aureliella helgolandensis TaxID=2527968 RepID=A0A518G1B5_9BACT|nr:FHA domain-containing protein [Aureliella helgolandensis]QDV22334.1 hypothetical protein Q31a_06180 [Aureliella helgolandensis]